ncbi:type I-E CRISPR-associated protein Cas5/CasD [Thiorhodovibrio litoralis]|nr:type I-E CRISPR-associated protein Cas5/CasD [Thiorhodovibrio litoralis]
MQSWGLHSFEDYRPTNHFPTRSGLIGLFGACLGIERADQDRLSALNKSVEIAIRDDQGLDSGNRDELVASSEKSPQVATDFHTVLQARKVGGRVNRYPVVSRREYLFDARFTIAIGERAGAQFNLERIAKAAQHPCFTPVLGRRSCPLARPLLETTKPIEAADVIAALMRVEPVGGTIYAEEPVSDQPLGLRDVPRATPFRQFDQRLIYVHREAGK